MWHGTVAAACALLFYYGLPLDLDAENWHGFGIVAFVPGVLGLVWLSVRRIRHAVRESGSRAGDLLFVLCVSVTFFALFYHQLALHRPGQFDGIETRTDALYYSMITLATIGYGDVHAAGQAARIATMVQVAFDLIVIGTLFAISTAVVAERVAARRSAD
ncbi:potassium channel family protein [Nocardia callitridis]|uniref:Potassium channel family protein n=1 Tax=Nocardia callitridis TaxID=648753 RepID=A0ABP9JSQ4_9NOCA